jgi:hypothetical protein
MELYVTNSVVSKNNFFSFQDHSFIIEYHIFDFNSVRGCNCPHSIASSDDITRSTVVLCTLCAGNKAYR